MNKYTDQSLNQSYFKFKHKSGLNIIIYPKEGFSKTYAVIATHYGSIDKTFIPKQSEQVTVPGGIAHYLEHKLFEGEKEGAFERYARTGANANAFTSFDTTAYLFSCTEQFEDSLEILLDFVYSPYFTPENVEKERGIIGQEIRMYDDNSDWQVFFSALEAAYQNHPIREDIAGTVDSIAKITPELLYLCYNNFYNPSEMVLCVVGNATPETVMNICDKVLKEKEPSEVKRIYPEEPALPYKKVIEKKLSVSKTIFNIGIKDNVKFTVAGELCDRAALTDILLELIIGKASPLYKDLYQKGLIGLDFSKEYMYSKSYGIAVFGGESDNPKAVYDSFFEYCSELIKNFPEKDFERCKKAVYGNRIQLLNEVEGLGNEAVSAFFTGTDVFELLNAYRRVTPEMALERLKSFFDEQYAVISIINPV
ncbi:MAG: insulinase family protein [Ruminococcaceae bacterium]|nr:insulinase family protein [Oscillospiraceae bacterium]